MTDKVPLAEQIGVIDEVTAEYALLGASGKLGMYTVDRRVRGLKSARGTLVFLMNNRDEFLAFMAGKEGE